MKKESIETLVENVRTATDNAIKTSEHISEEVRNITIEALSKHHLDFKHIKLVIKAVLKGAQDAVENTSNDTKEILKEVAEGLDNALEKSAHASKLAIEETAGRIKDFTNHDIKRAMDDLAGLEDIFIETLTEVANNSNKLTTDVFRDLVSHFKNSGTAVGRKASQDVMDLTRQFVIAGKENIKSVNNITMSFAENIARASSGFMTGIADSLKETNKDNKPTEKQK